jgi:hypothetical protein
MKYVLLAIALAACNPTLTQQSVAPPGRAARLDPVNRFWGLKHYRLELSEGVALAVTCDQGGPCAKPIMVSEDPAIAEVRQASLQALQQVGFSSTALASAFVIVGKAPGTTKLHVKTKDGKRDVLVTVIAPPGPPNNQTAATAAN